MVLKSYYVINNLINSKPVIHYKLGDKHVSHILTYKMLTLSPNGYIKNQNVVGNLDSHLNQDLFLISFDVSLLFQ